MKLTFEQFTNKYPKQCQGCIILSIDFQEYKQLEVVPHMFDMCDFTKQVDKCPCTTCLVKMKCLNQCELFDSLYDLHIRPLFKEGEYEMF